MSKTETILSTIAGVSWETVTADMHEKGWALIPGFLSPGPCGELLRNYSHPGAYRKTVVMERYRFGRGEYKYFDYPLPPLVQTLREQLYPKLVPIANDWMDFLQTGIRFPDRLTALQDLCQAAGQVKPTPLILQYRKGGHNTLHQDLYGEVYFPLQSVLFLSEPAEDFSGGEFVLTQQTPRAQSKAIVLQHRKGDLLVFTTHSRPVKGARGYYRVNMRHGVSEVLSGERYTLGIIFHDART